MHTAGVRACLQVGDYNVSVVAGGSSSIVNHSAFIRLDCPKEYFGTDGERCSACPVRGLAACIQKCASRITITEYGCAADSPSSSLLYVCVGRFDCVCRRGAFAMVSERIRMHSAGTSPFIGEPLCNARQWRRVWAA